MDQKPSFTKGPWNICWQTYNGRRTNFHITASPYGSVRPLARTDWKIEWSEVEGDELVANANLMGAAPELYDAVSQARSYIHSLPIQNQKSFEGIDLVLRNALAKAEGRS